MAKSRISSFSCLDGCEIVALAARNAETGTALSKEYEIPYRPDWRELLNQNDVDAVIICTNNDSHGTIALAAINAGKHVFLEYPLARSLEECNQLVKQVESTGRVLRIAHDESLSAVHRQLKEQVNLLGDLLTTVFVRLTPGKGARPDVLFNLNISGPPALFFIYHISPLVDLFGPAVWVEGHAEYPGLEKSGRYEQFINAVTVKFERGGSAHWTWAGGIAINKAEEYQRIIMSEGTLIKENGKWFKSLSENEVEIQFTRDDKLSLEELFLNEVRGVESLWRDDLQREYEAVTISLAAEISFQEKRRVFINEPLFSS